MRNGMAILEVLILVLIVGLAIVPVMTLGTSTHRAAYFGEQQQAAIARARALIDLASCFQFRFLAELYRMKNGPSGFDRELPVDPQALLGGGSSMADSKVARMFGAFADTPPDRNTERLLKFEHKVVFVLRSVDSGEVIATVSWRDPSAPSGEARGGPSAGQGGARSVRLAKLLVSKEAGLAIGDPLPKSP
jgi:hypothetical protein